MIEVFNQHIYVQSRHFHTEITKKGKKKKSKMHFFLSDVKTAQVFIKTALFRQVIFQLHNHGHNKLIVQDIFQSWKLMEHEKTRHLLPEQRTHRCPRITCLYLGGKKPPISAYLQQNNSVCTEEYSWGERTTEQRGFLGRLHLINYLIVMFSVLPGKLNSKFHFHL